MSTIEHEPSTITAIDPLTLQQAPALRPLPQINVVEVVTNALIRDLMAHANLDTHSAQAAAFALLNGKIEFVNVDI